MQRRWLLGGILIVGGVGLLRSATARPRVGPTTRLLVIGDSLAVGLQPHLRQLSEEAGVADYSARGLVGSRLDQWARDPWLAAELVRFRPTLVLVSLGTNDAAIGPDAAERQQDALVELVGKLRESGADIAWVGPPTLPFPDGGIPDLIRGQVKAYFPSEDYEIPRAPDELHPTASGYAGWAGAIWQWLT